MKNFIVFEGLDGAGKSTLLKDFVKTNSHYRSYYSVPDSFKEFRKIIDETNDPLAALHFFGLCNLIRGKEIKENLEKGNQVVMDRYIFTTLAYQYQMIGDEVMKWFDLIKSSKNIILPDLVVFVTASSEVIKERIMKRDISNGVLNKTEWYGDEISKNQGISLRKAYIAFLERTGVKWFEFDTSKYSITEQIFVLNEKIQAA